MIGSLEIKRVQTFGIYLSPLLIDGMSYARFGMLYSLGAFAFA